MYNRPIFFLENFEDYELNIKVQEDKNNELILNCNVLHEGEVIDTIEINSLSELQDVVTVNCQNGKYNVKR